MTYNEMIQGLINNNLKSPQIYEESFYINLRVTGTGVTERYKEDKNGNTVFDNSGKPIIYRIDRCENEFLSEKFLDACTGIPVLIEHPNKQLLDGENYKDYVVGTVIKAFIKPELKEVWCVARIYSPEVLKLITEKLKSTSPAVISNNDVIENDIIKEHFEYIDHLALVVDGYWDNYSEKAIQIDNNKRLISNNKLKEDNMPDKLEETKEVVKEGIEEDTVKKDESLETVENKESGKINAILEAVNKLSEAIMPSKLEIKEDEEPVQEENLKKEEEQALVLDKILQKLDEISSSIISKASEKETEDINEDLSISDITEDSIEEEEETKVLADKAYILASKYKEDGAKWTKIRPNDNRYSYLQRWLKQNASLCAEKFKSLTDMKIDKNNFALAVDAMKSIEDNLEMKTKEKIEKASSGKILISDDGKGSRVYKNVF